MNSPLAYIGGKSRLSKSIISMIPDHQSYCEVFCGAGWVFFRKDPSKFEVLNDLDSELVTFYRVLQNHFEEFCRQFKWLLSSREWFHDWNRQLKADGLTDIQKAARYYYIQRLCFGGRVKGRSYGAAPNRHPRINLLRLEEELSEAHLRIARATIENLSWKAFLATYDRADTFFFLDPPYYKAPYYNHNLELADYKELADTLSNIQGRFILTINDHPVMRRVFAGYRVKPVALGYSVAREKATRGKELLVCNFKPKSKL